MKKSQKIITHSEGPETIINGKRVFMAQHLMGAADDETVIYVDGNPMNNRKANLRVVKTVDLKKMNIDCKKNKK